MFANWLKFIPFIFLFFVSACTTSQTGSQYGQSSVGHIQEVMTGTVVSAEPVTIDPESPAIGTVAGAAIGGIAASHIGSGRGQAIATIGGALLGGALGSKAEGSVRREDGVNLVIRLNDDRVISIVQAADPNMRFAANDRVNIYMQGTKARVVRAY